MTRGKGLGAPPDCPHLCPWSLSEGRLEAQPISGRGETKSGSGCQRAGDPQLQQCLSRADSNVFWLGHSDIPLFRL